MNPQQPPPPPPPTPAAPGSAPGPGPAPGFAPGAGRPRPEYRPRKIACPSCGDQLEIKDENGRLAVCPSCGSHLEISLAEARVLAGEAGNDGLARVFQLQIGDRFTRDGARYEVIGRLRLDEFDVAEPTLNYLLFNPRRGTLWLSEYDGHWDLSETSRVMPSADARTLKKGEQLITYDGAKWLLGGKGVYQTTYVDGALPWVAQLRDEVEYAELVAADGSGETYEVEWPKSGREMEAGRGSLLTVEEVRRATGKDITSPDGPRENVHEITKSYGRMKWAAFFFVVFNLAALVFFSLLGNRVLLQSFSAEELTGEVLSEPFEVRQAGTALKVRLSAPLDNEWIAVDLGLVRDDGEPVVTHVTDTDFQYYSGREGGESWSEGSRSSSRYLYVDQAGTYRLLLRAVSGQGNAQTATRAQVPLDVRVHAGAKRVVWLVLALIGSVVAWVVVYAQHHQWRTADDEDEDDE